MINITSSSRYKINRRHIKKFCLDFLSKHDFNDQYDLNIIFVGKTKMKSISAEYKKENVALPVLAFPYDNKEIEKTRLIGEIFLCYPQIILLAAERSKRVEDMILKLLEHGMTNLLK